MGDSKSRGGPTQLSLPLHPPLRVIRGGGKRVHERLLSRDSVVRVLVETGADMLLRRISVARAEEIEGNVDRILELFDRVDQTPALMPMLERQLAELEALMTQSRAIRSVRRGG
ncbi:MAG: hypothetical protein ACYC8T_04295 [Myxococcaceae bacterium]